MVLSRYHKHHKENHNYIEEELSVDNTPDFGDNGEKLLDKLETAIKESHELINNGYKLSTVSASPDRSFRAVLRKEKKYQQH